MEKWPSQVTTFPVTTPSSGLGCSHCSPRSQPRSTAQPRDCRSTNREISFMAGQLFCINLRRLAGSVIQLWAGAQEAYLRKSLHGHLAGRRGKKENDCVGEKKKVEDGTIKPSLGEIVFSFLPRCHLLCLDRGSWGPGLCPGTLSTSQYSSAAHTP